MEIRSIMKRNETSPGSPAAELAGSGAPSSSWFSPHKGRVCPQVRPPHPVPPGLWKCLDTRGGGKLGIFPRSGEG